MAAVATANEVSDRIVFYRRVASAGRSEDIFAQDCSAVPAPKAHRRPLDFVDRRSHARSIERPRMAVLI
jgi:hypothetical protein